MLYQQSPNGKTEGERPKYAVRIECHIKISLKFELKQMIGAHPGNTSK